MDFSAFYQVPPPPPSLAQSQANSAPPVKPWFQGGSRAPGREQQLAGSPCHQCAHPQLSSTHLEGSNRPWPGSPNTPPWAAGHLSHSSGVSRDLRVTGAVTAEPHPGSHGKSCFSSCCHHLEVLPRATVFTSLSLSVKWETRQE